MKPEKPRKTKAPARRTRAIADEEAPAKAAKPPAARRAAARKPAAKAAGLPVEAVPKAATIKRARVSKTTAATSPRAAAFRRKIPVPPILLEGDTAPTLPRSGPGERYAIGSSEAAALEGEAIELPESYGTQRLLLVARDPHWLYAHWDMTANQLRQHNAASRDGHLAVRVFRDQFTGKPVIEQHVHPESRNWFLHVPWGGAKYVAQLGYYDGKGKWNTVSASPATFTPPDVLSDDTSVRFETIPVEVPFKKLIELVKGAVADHTPLVEAIQELREAGHPELPRLEGATSPDAPQWTAEQERALAQIVNIDEVRRVWMGSLEITELLRRALEREISSQAAAAFARGEQFGAEQPSGIFSVSSPFGGEERRKGFWFNVNAELIIYGATEPGAAVTIGGRKIQLRRDGTFSFRFALPDGNYDLPVQATSADGDDSRASRLHFRRATEYRGEVGKHPQDARLKTPRVESVS